MEQMLLQIPNLLAFTVDMDSLERGTADQIPEECQTQHMIQMRMRQQDRKFRSLDKRLQAKHAAPGIEEQTALGEKVGSRMPSFARVITGCS
jgi:hypothetical protein